MLRNVHKVLAISLILSSATGFADVAQESGFDFSLSIHSDVDSGSSQSNTDKSNEITKDLDNNGREKTEASVFLLARWSYTLPNKKTQFFLGDSEADVVLGDINTELGLTHEIANGTTFTVAYTPDLFTSKAWEDPFLTNQKLDTTEVDSHGARIRVENFFSQPLTAEYLWGESDYKNEHSGQQASLSLSPEQQSLLQRDITYHQAYVEYTYATSATFAVQPALTFTQGDGKGDAMTFDKVDFQLAFLSQFTERSQLVTSINIGQSDYETSNPVFDKTQKDTHWGVTAFYSYTRPFNWKKTTFIAIAEYEKNDSNIHFYDEDSLAASIGLAYQF
ncbi:MAG: hypothetical protein ACI9D5_001247 [Candidatus Endobugula sp.]|jgi:hypothetical protein